MEIKEFQPPYPLKTPVLFLIFKRLNTTKQVFEQIRKAKPPKLYIAADGPRENVPGEAEKVKEVREFVLNNIDWDCEVKTLFREKNLGCGKAVSSAITWFFENEERGIILEDDTLPSLSFFWFCEELLERYKDDRRIGQIGGCNFQKGKWRGEGDYYFSKYNHIWGWASWRDRWKKYDFELKSISDDKFIENIHKEKKAQKYWKQIFWKMKRKEIDTWDYQWTFTLWYNEQLSIIPNLNLVSNIGFGKDATHTTVESEFNNMEHFELILKNHPKDIIQNIEADDFITKYNFLPKPFIIRVLNKLQRVLK